MHEKKRERKAMIILYLLINLFLYFSFVYSEVHGGTMLAFAGKDSVILVVDSRFSSQQTGGLLLSEHTRPVISVGDNTLIGCYGLESDSYIILSKLRLKLKEFHNSDLTPKIVIHVISNILYTSSLYCVPIIAGIDVSGPYICSMDSLGASTVTKGFAAIGKLHAYYMSIMKTMKINCYSKHSYLYYIINHTMARIACF